MMFIFCPAKKTTSARLIRKELLRKTAHITESHVSSYKQLSKPFLFSVPVPMMSERSVFFVQRESGESVTESESDQDHIF